MAEPTTLPPPYLFICALFEGKRYLYHVALDESLEWYAQEKILIGSSQRPELFLDDYLGHKVTEFASERVEPRSNGLIDILNEMNNVYMPAIGRILYEDGEPTQEDLRLVRGRAIRDENIIRNLEESLKSKGSEMGCRVYISNANLTKPIYNKIIYLN